VPVTSLSTLPWWRRNKGRKIRRYRNLAPCRKTSRVGVGKGCRSVGPGKADKCSHACQAVLRFTPTSKAKAPSFAQLGSQSCQLNSQVRTILKQTAHRIKLSTMHPDNRASRDLGCSNNLRVAVLFLSLQRGGHLDHRFKRAQGGLRCCWPGPATR
jgi:hypothetical protein